MVDIVIALPSPSHHRIPLQSFHLPLDLRRLHQNPYQQEFIRSLDTPVYEELILDKESSPVGLLLLVVMDFIYIPRRHTQAEKDGNVLPASARHTRY